MCVQPERVRSFACQAEVHRWFWSVAGSNSRQWIGSRMNTSNAVNINGKKVLSWTYENIRDSGSRFENGTSYYYRHGTSSCLPKAQWEWHYRDGSTHGLTLYMEWRWQIGPAVICYAIKVAHFVGWQVLRFLEGNDIFFSLPPRPDRFRGPRSLQRGLFPRCKTVRTWSWPFTSIECRG
jgi:hypothetical protein